MKLDYIGEFRAALDGVRQSPEKQSWLCWSYVLLPESYQQHAARDAVARLFAQERYHELPLVSWLDFAAQGHAGLTHWLRLEGIEAPEHCAAYFLCAWLWQCAFNTHENYPSADLHVCLGLGEGRALAMQWFHREAPMGRGIALVESRLAAGQLNTHLGLRDFPLPPEHCRWPR